MSPLVFIHIPKTAGTTLHKVLTHQYRPAETLVCHDSDGIPSAARLGGADTDSRPVTLVLGHVSARFHGGPVPVRYVTCLRDPVARVRSHYEHARNDPAHYLHRDANVLSLAEYAVSGLSGELDNGMVRMLAGIEDFHGATVDGHTLATAMETLEKRMPAFCLTERFDESLLLMSETLGWKAPWYYSRKLGRYRRTALVEAERDAIESANVLDRKLHTRASALLAERLAAMPDGFEERVDLFRRCNRHRGRLIFLAREVVRRSGGRAPF